MKASITAILLLVSALQALSTDRYRRETFMDVLKYSFTVEVSDTSDIIYGKARIRVLFTGSADTLLFDLRNRDAAGKGMVTDSVMYEAGGITWHHSNNKISVIPARRPQPGTEGIITIVYHGIPADGLIISRNRFRARTFFSDNWPDRASNYLPCIDHPYDKAAVEFAVIAPFHYEVVGSGRLAEESHLDHGRKLTRWVEEVPLATKVMAFGAADFDLDLAGSPDSIPVWTYVFPGNRKEGYNDYSVAVKPFSFFIRLLGPYSYEKLANVQSKTIFGGLENAGCIFYSERSVTGLGKAEGLMAHEIAHQWFGNSVTENDWYHIWLSEGFATYLAAVYMEKSYGRERFEQIMRADRDMILRYSEKSAAPVIDTTIADLMRLLSINSYQKGSWVLHMLRNEIGDDVFWKGMRLYYARFRNRNALTDDFREVMEEVSGRNLTQFFRQWLYSSGQPVLLIKRRNDPGRNDQTEITIEQRQPGLFGFPLELRIKTGKGDIDEKIMVTDRVTTITIPSAEVREIIPDPGVRLLFRMTDK